MKEIFEQYANYNKWANDRIIDAVLSLPVELIDKEVDSSFRSLRLTMLHVWQAEYVWWQRVQLAENIVSPATDTSLPLETIIAEWRRQSLQWQQWVIQAKEIALTHVIAYMNSKREQFKQPVYQILLQVCNHGTYHRGQIVTMLHQLGIEKILNTDFITWSRSRR